MTKKKVAEKKVSEFPDVVERTVHNYHDASATFNLTEGYKALVNPETEEVYSILSKRYQVIKHADIANMVEKAIKSCPEYGKAEKSVIFINKGQKMHMSYKFPDIEVPIDKGDLVNPKVDIFNSYDGTWSYNLLFGAFRLICTNGLVIGEKVLQYRKKHFQTFNEEDVKQLLIKAMDSFSEQTDIWKKWVDTILPTEKKEEILTALPLGKKQREEVEAEVEISSAASMDIEKRLTWWIFFNILCQYVTHRVKSDLRRIEIENAMRRVF